MKKLIIYFYFIIYFVDFFGYNVIKMNRIKNLQHFDEFCKREETLFKCCQIHLIIIIDIKLLFIYFNLFISWAFCLIIFCSIRFLYEKSVKLLHLRYHLIFLIALIFFFRHFISLVLYV